MTGGGHVLRVLVQIAAVCRILRVAVLHHQDAPPVSGRDQGPDWLGLNVRQDGSFPCAEVAAAALEAGELGSTVVVVEAPGGRTPQLVVVLEVLGQVYQVGVGGRAAQGAQFVVGGLQDLLEHGGVKVLSPDYVLFAWLFDLNYNGHNEKDDHNATGDPDYCSIGVVEVVQNVSFPFLCVIQKQKQIKTASKTKKHSRNDTFRIVHGCNSQCKIRPGNLNCNASYWGTIFAKVLNMVKLMMIIFSNSEAKILSKRS